MRLSEEDLIQTLEAPGASAKEREEAAAELVERCRQDAALRDRFLMRFVTFLADEAPIVRGWGIVGVLLCDEELEHLPRILRLLDDPSPGVRLQAAHALAPLGLPEVEAALADKLDDEDRLVRVAAAMALAIAKDTRSVPVLLDGIGSRRSRFDALFALRHVAPSDGERRDRIERGARAVFSGFLTSRFDRVAAAGVLATLGDERAGRYLLERARKGRLDRPLAIELVGELPIPGGEDLLASIAADRADPFRGAALRGLGSSGAERAYEACRAALADEAEDADVRCDAAEGLLLLGGDRAERALIEAEGGAGNERVRRVASTCLSLFGKPREEVRLYLPLTGDEVVS